MATQDSTTITNRQLVVAHLKSLMCANRELSHDPDALRVHGTEFALQMGVDAKGLSAIVNKKSISKARLGYWASTRRATKAAKRKAAPAKKRAAIKPVAPKKAENAPSPEKLHFAEVLKAAPTYSETLLKKGLDRQFAAYNFQFQAVLFGYIPDFYSESLKMIIEVDGLSHHARERQDGHRDQVFAHHGIVTVRINALRVLSDTADVLNTIGLAINDRCRR